MLILNPRTIHRKFNLRTESTQIMVKITEVSVTPLHRIRILFNKKEFVIYVQTFLVTSKYKLQLLIVHDAVIFPGVFEGYEPFLLVN